MNRDRIISGDVEISHPGVNVLPTGTRIGHDARVRAMMHIHDTAKLGYITDQEAEARVKAAQSAERQADINSLTADLPAPFVSQSYFQGYDWDKTKYWLPTLLIAQTLSLIIAVLPTTLLAQVHLFPHNPVALTFGVVSMIVGGISFFTCFGGILVKSG